MPHLDASHVLKRWTLITHTPTQGEFQGMYRLFRRATSMLLRMTCIRCFECSAEKYILQTCDLSKMSKWWRQCAQNLLWSRGLWLFEICMEGGLVCVEYECVEYHGADVAAVASAEWSDGVTQRISLSCGLGESMRSLHLLFGE